MDTEDKQGPRASFPGNSPSFLDPAPRLTARPDETDTTSRTNAFDPKGKKPARDLSSKQNAGQGRLSKGQVRRSMPKGKGKAVNTQEVTGVQPRVVGALSNPASTPFQFDTSSPQAFYFGSNTPGPRQPEPYQFGPGPSKAIFRFGPSATGPSASGPSAAHSQPDKAPSVRGDPIFGTNDSTRQAAYRQGREPSVISIGDSEASVEEVKYPYIPPRQTPVFNPNFVPITEPAHPLTGPINPPQPPPRPPSPHLPPALPSIDLLISDEGKPLTAADYEKFKTHYWPLYLSFWATIPSYIPRAIAHREAQRRVQFHFYSSKAIQEGFETAERGWHRVRWVKYPKFKQAEGDGARGGRTVVGKGKGKKKGKGKGKGKGKEKEGEEADEFEEIDTDEELRRDVDRLYERMNKKREYYVPGEDKLGYLNRLLGKEKGDKEIDHYQRVDGNLYGDRARGHNDAAFYSDSEAGGSDNETEELHAVSQLREDILRDEEKGKAPLKDPITDRMLTRLERMHKPMVGVEEMRAWMDNELRKGWGSGVGASGTGWMLRPLPE